MMDYIPFVVQVCLSAVLKEDAIPLWWETEMVWPGEEYKLSPAEMWEADPMRVIDRLESYLEPQVFT